jgi:hypothetical protein
MEKCNNPNCEKILIHTEGRRKKKYCSATCRNKISMVNFLSKPKELKTIRITIEEYDRLIAASKSIAVPKIINEIKQSNVIIQKTEYEPKEGSMAFIVKYGCSTYEELKNLKP